MAVRLLSAESEKQALRALCSIPSSGSQMDLLGSLNAKHFATGLGKEAFARLTTIMKTKNALPSWADFVRDPRLSADTRSALKAFKGAAPDTVKRRAALAERLDHYRRLRALNAMCRDVSEAMTNGDTVDVESLVDMATRKVAEAGVSNADLTTTIIGKADNSSSRVKNILLGKSLSFIPSGFRAFDDRNQGIIRGSLITLSAPSGEGKSLMIQTLARNFALGGARVGFFPLEMDADGLLNRELAFLTKIPVHKFINPKKTLTKKERALAFKKYEAQARRIRANGGSITIFEGVEGMTVDQLLLLCKPYGFDAIFIDYIGLVGGTDGDDQAKALGRATARLKQWASANSSIACIAAQLDDDSGKIKYSKAIQAHCVTGDMKVQINDSNGLPISDTIPNIIKMGLPESVLTVGGRRAVLRTFDLGVQPAVRFMTSAGDQLGVSCTTQLLRWDERRREFGWAVADYLRPGHVIFKYDPALKQLYPATIIRGMYTEETVYDLSVERVEEDDLSLTLFKAAVVTPLDGTKDKESSPKAYKDSCWALADGHFLANGYVVHNSPNMWTFQRTAEEREHSVLTVKQPKSRQQDGRPFSIYFDLATMTARDMTPEEAKAWHDAQGRGQPGAGKDGKGRPTAGRSKSFFGSLKTIA